VGGAWKSEDQEATTEYGLRKGKIRRGFGFKEISEHVLLRTPDEGWLRLWEVSSCDHGIC
jgi:hypothetical protein